MYVSDVYRYMDDLSLMCFSHVCFASVFVWPNAYVVSCQVYGVKCLQSEIQCSGRRPLHWIELCWDGPVAQGWPPRSLGASPTEDL